MKLITRNEAAKLSLAELQGLLREAFNELAAAPRCSEERKNALCSLEAIERELKARGPSF